MNNWTYDELKSVVQNFIDSTDHSASKEEKKKEIKIDIFLKCHIKNI